MNTNELWKSDILKVVALVLGVLAISAPASAAGPAPAGGGEACDLAAEVCQQPGTTGQGVDRCLELTQIALQKVYACLRPGVIDPEFKALGPVFHQEENSSDLESALQKAGTPAPEGAAPATDPRKDAVEKMKKGLNDWKGLCEKQREPMSKAASKFKDLKQSDVWTRVKQSLDALDAQVRSEQGLLPSARQAEDTVGAKVEKDVQTIAAHKRVLAALERDVQGVFATFNKKAVAALDKGISEESDGGVFSFCASKPGLYGDQEDYGQLTEASDTTAFGGAHEKVDTALNSAKTRREAIVNSFKNEIANESQTIETDLRLRQTLTSQP